LVDWNLFIEALEEEIKAKEIFNFAYWPIGAIY
jgi:hypothetical protein